MKKLYVLSALFFVTTQIFPQWPARYNAGNKGDQGRLIAIDPSNNVYVSGRSEDKKGNADYATIKYNAAGVQQWVARYNGYGNGYDNPQALAIDNSGNVYVTGSSAGNGTSYDYATVKYNSNGVQQWVARYDDPTHRADAAKDVKVDAAGNVFVTGYVDGETVNINGNAIVTIKYNSSGVLQWIDRYDDGPSLAEDANSLALDGAGNVYITGRGNGLVTVKYNDLGTSVQREWVRNFGSSGNGQRVLIDALGNAVVSGWSYTTLKYDPLGNLLWSAEYNGPGNSEGLWDMTMDASGNIYTVGYSYGTDGSADYLTLKYNGDGQAQWEARYSGTDAARDLPRAIAVDNSGGVYVTGTTQPTNGSRTATSDYLTIKYNSTGQEEWVATYDGAKSADGAFAIALDGSGNVFVTGESAAKTSNFDYATVRYSQSMVTRSAISNPITENNKASLIKLTNYPNPFAQTTTIEYHIPQDGKVKLSIFDLQGREVALLVNETQAAGVYKINFASGKLNAGIYQCRLQAENSIQNKKMIVVR